MAGTVSMTTGKMKIRAPLHGVVGPKKSFTLSAESIAFIDSLRRERGGSSCSAVREQILESVRLTHERALIAREFANYYSALSANEATEQTGWGEFALRELTAKECTWQSESP